MCLCQEIHYLETFNFCSLAAKSTQYYERKTTLAMISKFHNVYCSIVVVVVVVVVVAAVAAAAAVAFVPYTLLHILWQTKRITCCPRLGHFQIVK